MIKLEELHDTVKLHPYRLNLGSADVALKGDYNKSVKALLEEFWAEAMKIPYLKKARSYIGLFYHDFLSALMRRLNYTADEVIHLERCIACIHRFIDTGRVDEFYTYYTGVNICDSLNRSRKYIYDAKKDCFVPQFSLSEVKNALREYEDYIANGGMLFSIAGKYTEHGYATLKQQLEHMTMNSYK